MTPPSSPPPAVSFWQALRFWFKLGLISFGGPAGQIALMHAELVEKRRWISAQRFLHALNYCMLLPGPEAQQLATYIGWLLHKRWGGVCAGVLFVLPSFFILLALSWIYLAWGHLPLVSGLFYGIKPAVSALVLQAAYRMGGRVLSNPVLWLIALLSFAAIFFLNAPFPLIVLLAALCGWVGGRWLPAYFQSKQSHTKTGQAQGAALIDDDTPRPIHAQFSGSALTQMVLIGTLLWLLPMACLMIWQGWHGSVTQMGWFFTKAALLTFGGAYAVLPYVYQGAVAHYGWLTPLQMIDGLALGETTPGPLIMIVTFVGFVGGYTQPMVSSPFWSGALAAWVVTWFTFLPSFIFILAGGPFIESTHGKLAWTAPLTAITAAVVGVVFNLALFFAYHVVWPQGWSGQVDGMSALLMLAAAVALMRYQRNVIHVIAACAVLGCVMQWGRFG